MRVQKNTIEAVTSVCKNDVLFYLNLKVLTKAVTLPLCRSGVPDDEIMSNSLRVSRLLNARLRPKLHTLLPQNYN